MSLESELATNGVWSFAANATSTAATCPAALGPPQVAAPTSPRRSSNLNWTGFTRRDFRDALDCRGIFSRGPRPIRDYESTWRSLRRVYLQVVGAENSSIDPPLLLPKDGDGGEYAGDGFAVPYYVDYSPGMGRGAFAKDDIEEGDTVWRSTYTAIFEEADVFREFLASIPADLACDVMEWSYAYTYDDDDTGEQETIVCLDLDAMSFCNDGSISGRQNLRHRGAKNSVEEDETVIAARRINAGEELLCDYSAFFDYEGWSEMGL